MSKKMFEGLKIVDFTTVIAGPFITKTMAAYGAEVIKIESRSHPDLWRGMGGGGRRAAMMGMAIDVRNDIVIRCQCLPKFLGKNEF